MEGRIAGHFLKKLRPETAPIHHEGGHGFGGPLERLAGASNDPTEALAQIGEVVRGLKINGRSLGRVDEIAVQDFGRAADFRTPPFEHVLLPSVVLGVGIEVEVAPHRFAQVLLIEAPERLEQSPVRRQRLELIALGVGKRTTWPKISSKSSQFRYLVCSMF